MKKKKYHVNQSVIQMSKLNGNDITDVGDITFGGKKGYEFKLKELPKTYEEFREFMICFQEAFQIGWTLKEESFKKLPSKYVDQSTVKEVNNLF